MEPLPCEVIFLCSLSIHLLIAILRISEDRIADRGEMDSYLMCASREEIYFEECILIIDYSLIEKFRFSDFWIYRISGCHLFPVIGIASDE